MTEGQEQKGRQEEDHLIFLKKKDDEEGERERELASRERIEFVKH